jgi:hypothetical protein
VAGALAEAGWTGPALAAGVRAAELADRAGDPAVRAEVLAELAGSVTAAVRGAPARLRIRVWHARAVLRHLVGDGAGARRSLRHGLAVAERHRATLGATELRVHAAAEVDDLAALGLRWAVARGWPVEVLDWAERHRAATLRGPGPGHPGAGVVGDLARLRQVTAELAATADPARAATLQRRQRDLEESVRRRTWRGSTRRVAAARTDGPGLAAIAAALGERVLVEFVHCDGFRYAVVVVDGRAHLRPVGATAALAGELASLRFTARRLVLGHRGPAALAALTATHAHAAGRLDAALLAPLAPLIGDRPLVLVPTGELHGLAWAALPNCRDRPVTVAPSAHAWWRSAGTAPGPDRPTVLVAAADPPHAPGEVAALAAEAPGARVLVGPAATVPAVLSAMEGAGTVHIACHGAFRADNPLFSHLTLADGPLNAYDLTRLRRPPRLLVLSACEGGLAAVHPGDELMGLGAALLGTGTGTLIASVAPVDDQATPTLMRTLHRHLRAGAAPAVALARAQAATGTVSATGFLCLGAG